MSPHCGDFSPPCGLQLTRELWSYFMQVPQQQGVLFMLMQQVHPAIIMVIMASQQHWIILQQSASPLVQVIIMPLSVISHLHMPIIRLQVIIIMPFIIIEQLIMPPQSILAMFCIMLTAIMSSLMHIIFIPPSHFSIFMVQLGIIIMFMLAAGIALLMPGIIVCIPIVERSIVIIIFRILKVGWFQ
jgi:hypothetical protein